MGWEVRSNGRRYLYRNRRVDGKPIKEYLAADDRFGFGALMAHELERVQIREAKLRALTRKVQREYRERIDGLLRAALFANADLRAVVEGVLYAVGFHRHNRGDWRMKKALTDLRKQIEQLEARAAKASPVINYQAPKDDAEAVELYAKARAGDAAATGQVRQLIVTRGWVDWVGDLGRQATHQLIHTAAGGDPVWKAGLTEKAEAVRKELLGETPSVLEHLLARRVVNGWVATHALELELTVRPPTDARSKEHLDKALTRAQKRMTEAVTELARVRRLQAPRVLTQLNVIANPTVLNAAPSPQALTAG